MPAYSYDQWCKDFARSFAAAVPMETDLPCFDVSGTDENGLKREFTVHALTGADAVVAGLERGLNGVVAHPHPQELTYEQGKARYPKALRMDAFTDAWRGWTDAQTEARAAKLARGERDDASAIERSYDFALVAQMQRPDELERAQRRGYAA